jgi:hypothetical protein
MLELIKTFWPILVAIAFTAVVWWAKASYDEKQREIGREELRPQLVACNKAYAEAAEANRKAQEAIATIHKMYGNLQEALKQLELREMAAKARGDNLRAQLAAKEKERLQTAMALEKALKERSETPTAACIVADDVLSARAARGVIR